MVQFDPRGPGAFVAGLVLLLCAAGAARAEEPPNGAAQFLDEARPPPAAPSGRLERSGSPLAWTFAVEGGLATTDDPEGILGLPLPRGTRVFDWGENGYDAAFALRFTATRHFRRCERFELRGSWMSWDDSSDQEARRFGFSQTPGAGVLISPTASATLSNETDLLSIELNWWRTSPGRGNSRFEYAIGARMLRLDDEASATAFVGLAPDSFLRGEAINTLWAAQGSVAWRLGAWQRFELAVSAKGMIGLLNRDLSESDASIVTGGATTDARRERTDFGWALEGEVQAIFRPVARVGITASYTLLFMGDVTRAHEMLDFSQAATGSVQIVDAKDDLLVHTLFFGVRIDL